MARNNSSTILLALVGLLLLGLGSYLGNVEVERSVTFDSSQMRAHDKFLYMIKLDRPPLWATLRGDTGSSPRASRLVLSEDGTSLERPHSQHAEIAEHGKGRYSHWHKGTTLYFSSSDNTDSLSNGRQYTASFPLNVAWWIYLPILTLGALCLIPISLNLKRRINLQNYWEIGRGMKSLFMVFVSLLFFAMTYKSGPGEFTKYDLGFIVVLMLVVFVVQDLISYLFGATKFLNNVLLSIFAIINIVSLNLILNEEFVNLPIYLIALAIIVGLFIVFNLMNLMGDHAWASKVLPALTGIATVVILVQATIDLVQVTIDSRPKPADAGQTSAENIKLVEFKTKPNVYFISFDALIPKALLAKHIGLETTAYHEVLDVHFRRFRNFFADRVVTKRSLNSLLAFDMNHYDLMDEKDRHKFFSGLTPSPLFEIFKHNGYETNTLFNTNYFGDTKGPYVDNYFVDTKFGACRFLDPKLADYTFLGYCKLIKSRWVLALLQTLNLAASRDPMGFLLDKLQNGVAKDTPQVFVAYIYSPGHTQKTFRSNNPKSVEEYKSYFLKASKQTSMYIQSLIDFILTRDRDAILYVFGDHGPYVARGQKFAEDKTFFVQDLFGVYGGIFPKKRCSKSFDNPYNSSFMTISQGAHMIVRCLTGGEDAFRKFRGYSLKADAAFSTMGKQKYEDFLYE